MKNDQASFRTNPLGKLWVQPSLVVNRFDGEGGWTKSKSSDNNNSHCFLTESRCHLSIGYRRGFSPVSLNGTALIFSDSLSDGKPIQIGWPGMLDWLSSKAQHPAVTVMLRYGGFA